jgi:hypothetical protein
MSSLLSQELMLGSARAVPQVSLNPAAWTALASRGLITVSPAPNDASPAVIVTITEAGKAALLDAADAT